MMRLTLAIWWSLALVWLATSQAGADSPPGQPANHAIDGMGRTVEEAKSDALRKAAEATAKHLWQHQPPLVHWRPSEKFVQQHLLDGPGHPGPEPPGFPGYKGWTFTLKIPDNMTLVAWDRAAEREERAERRMGQTFHVVAALFLLLLVAVGYCKVDDMTRFRYTPWLRLASVALLALAAAGWWWVK